MVLQLSDRVSMAALSPDCADCADCKYHDQHLGENPGDTGFQNTENTECPQNPVGDNYQGDQNLNVCTAPVCPPVLRQGRIQNRLRAVLLHVPWYMIEGQSRLAADIRVSRSTISRLMNGRIQPSYRLVEKVTEAISHRLGETIDARDLFTITTDGTYPTPSACDLTGCGGCLPPWAWDERRDSLKPEWKDARPGDWSVSASLPASRAMPVSVSGLREESTTVNQ